MSPRFALALVLSLAACREPPTQVLVRLATDIPDIDTLVILVEDQDGEVVRETALPPDRLRAIPADGRFYDVGSFGVVPRGGDSTRRFLVRADVTVRRGEVVRFETRARTGFVDGRTIRLDIYVASLCIELAAMCEEEGLTCGIDGCVPEDVPPELLPPIDDPVDPDDPRDPRTPRDAGADASLDAAATDASEDASGDASGDAAVDGATDGGGDASSDAGPRDASPDTFIGFDSGPPPMPRDPPLIRFPWNGYRSESLTPTFAWESIPGATHYFVVLRAGTERTFVTRAEPHTHVDGMTIQVRVTGLGDLTPRGLWNFEVVSCVGPMFPVDCGPPIGPARYLWVGTTSCDFDGDGDAEPVVGHFGGQVEVWEAGPTAAPRSLTAHVRPAPTAVVCADVDGDGSAELLAAASEADDVALFDWGGTQLIAQPSPFRASAQVLVAADFDFDPSNLAVTRDDVVLADAATGQVRVSLNGGPLVDVPRDPRLAGRAPAEGRFGRWGRDLAVADVDADGHPDLLIADTNHPDEDLVPKGRGAIQIAYGDTAAPFVRTDVIFAPEDGELFGLRVAGLGIDEEGRGTFVVGAPQHGPGNEGAAYTFRAGVQTSLELRPAGAVGCCFPSALAAREQREVGAQRYVAGFGDNQGGGANRGGVYLCADGACSSLGTIPARDGSFFGFEVVGELGARGIGALSRASGLNGLYLYSGSSWTRVTGGRTVDGASRLP